MAYRLESIEHVTSPLRCSQCGRSHRTVCRFRGLRTVVPVDPTQPVRVEDTADTKVTGPRCAYKLLEQVPVVFYADAKAQIDAVNFPKKVGTV